ncbi:MAG: TRAP transporter substrate-binding protein [Rhodospirillaceae bacterium]|nr:TRAP transporter substrate-binding protein [Rhodospirillaceae bacterium]
MKTKLKVLTGIGMSALLLGSWPALAETKISLAHVANTEDAVHAAALTFARVAKAESGGELNIRIFPSSQLGKGKEVLEGIQQGTIGMAVDTLGRVSKFHKLAGIESMPYLFKDADHYFKIWNGPVGKEIKDKIAKEANFRFIGHMFRGTRELTSNRKITSIKDLAGLKIRVTPIKERLATWKAFGASPTPMAWSEVFTSLQQGVIEAQENPAPVIISQKLHEVQKYMILTSHMANGWTFVFNAKKFEAMPEKLRTALHKAADAASRQFNDNYKTNRTKVLAKIKGLGVEIITIDQAPFRAKAKEVVAQFPHLKPWYDRMVAQ